MTIYSLSDPRNGIVRYVGQTQDHVRRLKQHVAKPTSPAMRTWLEALSEEGLRPALAVLETCEDAEAGARETHWIRYFYETGALLNIHLRVGIRRTLDDVSTVYAGVFLTAALSEILPHLN